MLSLLWILIIKEVTVQCVEGGKLISNGRKEEYLGFFASYERKNKAAMRCFISLRFLAHVWATADFPAPADPSIQ